MSACELRVLLVAFLLFTFLLTRTECIRFSNTFVIKVAGTAESIESRYNLTTLHKVNDDTFTFIDEQDDSQRFNNKLNAQLDQDALVVSFHQEKVNERVLCGETLYISDPAYVSGSQDWYLDGIKVPGAWSKCLSGRGVMVAVVDRGIDANNPDLINNYDDDIDIDVQRNIDSAKPLDQNEVHGTLSAGVIAAQKNNFCGIGIAYGATITGVRLFGSRSLTDSMEAQALGHKLGEIDIFSNSWGPPGSGQTVSPVGPLTDDAIQRGIDQGRNGKGAIYVFAAGNGGIYQDSCSYDGYVNDIRTIGVTAVHENGRMLQSSERCSAIMVSAYSRNKLDRNEIVTTTNKNSGCTGKFARSSAAAPQVSAVIALALEANPSLNWRDVQHLLVHTSEHRRLRFWEEDTIVNAAKFKVSPAFGFGLVNAEKMVDYASRWIGVPAMKTCKIVLQDGGESEVPGVFRKYVECSSVRYLEHVEVTIDVTYCLRGYTKVIVTSPGRTRSVVMPGRVEDRRTTQLKWTSDTVHFWGEDPNGMWKVEIKPLVTGGSIRCRGPGALRDLSLKMHGTTEKPDQYTTSTLTDYCPIKKVLWDGRVGSTEKEANFKKLQESYFDLRNGYEKRLYELEQLIKKEKAAMQNFTNTKNPMNVSSLSTVRPRQTGCQQRFEDPIRGKLLNAGRKESQVQYGVTDLNMCLEVCIRERGCRSVTFISNMYQRERSGEWSHFGVRCYTNQVTADSSILKDPPSYIRGNFKIINRICDEIF